MAHVLVTGATGFIGEHLAKALLQQGDAVTCLVRRTSRTSTLQSLGVELAWGDVTDLASVAAAVKGQSVVYHVAGCVTASHRADLYRVNEVGARHVAQACAEQADPPTLVAISSLAAAGPSPEGGLRTETDLLAPVSEYGRSKRAGEAALQAFADRVPITVIRPPVVLGEGDVKGLELFKSIARYGVHLVPGRSEHQFSVIHVADLVPLLILAARRGQRLAPVWRNGKSWSYGYYFAASEQHPTWGELGRMVSAQLGRMRTRVLPVPMPLMWAVASSAEIAGRLRGRPFYFNFDKYREASAGSWACSAKKAADELGFAVAAPLPDRLHQIVAWYRQAGWL